MPSHIRPLSIVAVVALLIASPAYSWGNKGDEIVAAIAGTELSETARMRIKELLPQDTALPDASTWPGKAGRQIPDMDPYHFINFRKTLTPGPAAGFQAA